jgi:hypothetical protein
MDLRGKLELGLYLPVGLVLSVLQKTHLVNLDVVIEESETEDASKTPQRVS